MRYTKQNGYIGVLTVVIVSVITLSIAISASLLSTNELLYTFGARQSSEVLQMADGCADEAAQRLKLDPAYAGGTVPYDAGTCVVAVSGSGLTRTITASTTVGDISRTVVVDVSLLNNAAASANGIDLTSWVE